MSVKNEELTKQQLEDFIAYANMMESKLQLLLKETKTSLNDLDIIVQDVFVQCPLDSSHRIPKDSYANHMWHVHHYDTKLEMNEDIDFFYQSAPHLHRVHMQPTISVSEPSIQVNKQIDYENAPIIDPSAGIPLDFYSRMDPSDMEVVLNGMKQLPYTFLSIQLNLISLQRLNTHISSLFLQFNILDDQDLVNMVIALLLNQSTCHPDALVQELRIFFGSQTRNFVLELWKYLIRNEIKRIREDLIRMGDPHVITKRAQSKSETLPPMKWELVDDDDLIVPSKVDSNKVVGIDYKRRRKSYRAKMTHLTRRTVTQEHRDMINLRMQMLAADHNYRLVGSVDRVLTKNTPQEIEKEMREKRITPPELQFKNPLDARDSIRHRSSDKRKGRHLNH